MKCGKLTTKLRDAVPVCFIEEGKEIKRVKNIEIPDAITEYGLVILHWMEILGSKLHPNVRLKELDKMK